MKRLLLALVAAALALFFAWLITVCVKGTP